MHFQPAERNLYASITQTRGSVVIVPDTNVLLSFPRRDIGIRAYVSGSCVLVTQSLPKTERLEMMIPHPTTAQSTRGMLSLVEDTITSGWQKESHMHPWAGRAVPKEPFRQADSEARQR